MIQILVILLFLVAAFNASLGFIILLGAKRSVQSSFFFLFTLSVALWCFGIAMFYLADTAAAMVLSAKLYYVAAATIGFSLLAFAFAYLERKVTPLRVLLLITPYIMTVWVSLMSRGMIQGASIEEQSIVLNPGLYTFYTFYFMTYLYSAIALIGFYLVRAIKKKDKERYGLAYIFTALMVAGTFGVYFNLLLPFVGNYTAVWIGPLFSIIMVGLIFASILRHRLFDVRLVIARTVGYIMLLVALTLLYGSAVFIVSRLLFPSNVMSSEQYIVNIVLAVFTAFSYQPLKRFFDKVTDRIFFREAYDPQAVLDELSDVVVNQIELRHLTSESMELMRTALKSNFIVLALSEKKSVNNKGHQFVQGDISGKDIPNMADHFANEREVVMYRGSNQKDAVAKFMAKYNIELMLPLVASKNYLGYVLLGQKQNGGIYSDRDINFATIAANELAMACLNAQRFEEIKTFNKTLETRIEDATLKLRDSNKKLQDLDKSKDEFISMASHQLRTPLTAVKGYISMVLEGDLGEIPKEQRQVLEQAFDSSQRMVYLIGDFLNVSRIQTGKFMLEVTQVDLAQLIPEEVEQLIETASRRQIQIKADVASELPAVPADENKLRQVMMNFIDNAIYYSRANSVISVRLYKDGGDIVFKVIDTGIGVPKSEQPHLFTKFYRATNARQQRPDGTGIGLYMAKKVIVAHGGSIIFETKEGVGSTFGFRLPLKNKLKQLDQQPAATQGDAGSDRTETK